MPTSSRFFLSSILCLFSFKKFNTHADAFLTTYPTVSTASTAFINSNNNNKRNEIKTTNKMYFDFHDDPIVIPQEKYDAVLEWAFDSTPDKPPLAIQSSKLGHGHGLYATQPLSANNVVFTIPSHKCLTLEASKSHPTLGKALATLEEDLDEEFGSIAVLSAFLASEMLREHCAEWEEDPSLSGPYSPYISILPSGRAVSQQDHVLWWSEKEVNTLFEGKKPETATATTSTI
jgi:hypothetical protein